VAPTTPRFWIAIGLSFTIQLSSSHHPIVVIIFIGVIVIVIICNVIVIIFRFIYAFGKGALPRASGKDIARVRALPCKSCESKCYMRLSG